MFLDIIKEKNHLSMFVLNVVSIGMEFHVDTPYEINKLAKSHKRPNRPYGGYFMLKLCS